MVVNWVSSCFSFFLNASISATYIFTAPTCTTTLITLKPCALNAEIYSYLYNYYNYFDLCALNAETQHFVVRFNKFSLLCTYNKPPLYHTLGDHFIFFTLTNCDLYVYSHIPYKPLQDSDCRPKKSYKTTSLY